MSLLSTAGWRAAAEPWGRPAGSDCVGEFVVGFESVCGEGFAYV